MALRYESLPRGQLYSCLAPPVSAAHHHSSWLHSCAPPPHSIGPHVPPSLHGVPLGEGPRLRSLPPPHPPRLLLGPASSPAQGAPTFAPGHAVARVKTLCSVALGRAWSKECLEASAHQLSLLRQHPNRNRPNARPPPRRHRHSVSLHAGNQRFASRTQRPVSAVSAHQFLTC